MRMMRRAPLLIAAIAVVLALPAQALGLVLTPPGKSGADQYFETVPTSAGNAAPPQGGAPTKSDTRTLSQLGHARAGAARLSRLGKDGQAAAALAAETAPASPAGVSTGHGVTPKGSAGVPGQVKIGQPPGASPASALSSALTGNDDGGLGILLPLLLLTAFVVAIGVAVSASRRRTPPPDTAA